MGGRDNRCALGEERRVLEGAEPLKRVKSVAQLGEEKGEVSLPENESVTPADVIALRRRLGKHQVIEAGGAPTARR